MNKISKFVTEHPALVIISILLITVFLGFASTRLKMESDIKKLLPRDYPSVKFYNEIDEKFGGADQLLIVITSENIFQYESLSKIRRITEKLKGLSGVNTVFSITDMDEIKSMEGGVEVGPILDEIPSSKEQILAFKDKVLSDDKYAGTFISKDSQAALILAKLFPVREEKELIAEARALCQAEEGPEKIYLSGVPAISQIIQDWLVKDLMRLFPLVILLVAVVLFLSFRNWYGVVLPLSSVLISTIWAVGLMGLLNQKITVITGIVPIILISIGSAYGIHIIARYQEEKDGNLSSKVILQKVISSTGIAVFIAAITTMVGFASTAVSGISAVRTFGLTTAFGVGAAFVISVTFIPSVLQFVKLNRSERKSKKEDDGLDKALIGLGHTITTRRFWSSAIAIVLLVLAFAAYPRLTTESDPLKYFGQDSDVVQTANLVRDKFGGALTVDVLVEGEIQDPVLLSKMEQLEEKMKEIEVLGKPVSIVDVLKETNRLMNDDKKEFEVLPGTRQGVAQYLLLLSMTGSDYLENMITSDYESARITARVGTTTSRKNEEMVKEMKTNIKEIFGEDASVKLTGESVIMHDMCSMLLTNQIQSLLLAIGCVFLMIFIIYRTWIGALFCMTPIIMTVLLNFGIMGWLRIPLDMATIMIGSITIGIGIDYTVHLFNRYKEERLLGKERDEGIKITLRTVGRAVVYNAASVAMGFLILLFSEFEILKSFGLLVALTMVFSSFGALAILPDLIMLKFRLIKFNHTRKTRG